MTNSLNDILSNFSFDEPPEIRRVKDYIRSKYQIDAAVAISGNQLVITVPGAALAGSLRMHTVALQKAADTTKRLVIRIGR